jgi:hypothetical protein
MSEIMTIEFSIVGEGRATELLQAENLRQAAMKKRGKTTKLWMKHEKAIRDCLQTKQNVGELKYDTVSKEYELASDGETVLFKKEGDPDVIFLSNENLRDTMTKELPQFIREFQKPTGKPLKQARRDGFVPHLGTKFRLNGELAAKMLVDGNTTIPVKKTKEEVEYFKQQQQLVLDLASVAAAPSTSGALFPAAMPTGHAFAAMPTGHAFAAMPTGHAFAAMPTGHAFAAMPTGHAFAAMPTGHAFAAMPTGHAFAAMPTGPTLPTMPTGPALPTMPPPTASSSITTQAALPSFPAVTKGDKRSATVLAVVDDCIENEHLAQSVTKVLHPKARKSPLAGKTETEENCSPLTLATDATPHPGAPASLSEEQTPSFVASENQKKRRSKSLVDTEPMEATSSNLLKKINVQGGPPLGLNNGFESVQLLDRVRRRATKDSCFVKKRTYLSMMNEDSSPEEETEVIPPTSAEKRKRAKNLKLALKIQNDEPTIQLFFTGIMEERCRNGITDPPNSQELQELMLDAQDEWEDLQQYM